MYITLGHIPFRDMFLEMGVTLVDDVFMTQSNHFVLKRQVSKACKLQGSIYLLK